MTLEEKVDWLMVCFRQHLVFVDVAGANKLAHLKEFLHPFAGEAIGSHAEDMTRLGIGLQVRAPLFDLNMRGSRTVSRDHYGAK